MAYKKKIIDGKRFNLYREKGDGGFVFYLLDKENKAKGQVEAYRQIGGKFIIPFSEKAIKHLILEGFDEFPHELTGSFVISPFGFGFSNNRINSFLKYKFDAAAHTIVVSSKGASEQKGQTIQINPDDLNNLVSDINQEQYASSNAQRALVSNFLNKHFPNLEFTHQETNSNKNYVLRNLNQKLISQLTADDVEQIGRFYVDAAKKYKRDDFVRRMLLGLQKTSQVLTLQEIIKKYEGLLKKSPLEKEWQKFFSDHIALFDNRYVTQIDTKNISLARAKYPDLVLVDIYGYIDFYELKRSNITLLKHDDSHGTYYWSPDMAKAIAQASNYLQHAKENALSYAKAIKMETSVGEQKGLDVSVINPKAIIVAGTSESLSGEKMKRQFKSLRESLKDIEFLLYDELLDRLKNLLSSVERKINKP